MSFEVRRAVDGDRAWIDALMLERWSGPTQVANGREYRPAELCGRWPWSPGRAAPILKAMPKSISEAVRRMPSLG